MSMQYVQYMLLFLVLAVNSNQFQILWSCTLLLQLPILANMVGHLKIELGALGNTCKRKQTQVNKHLLPLFIALSECQTVVDIVMNMSTKVVMAV